MHTDSAQQPDACSHQNTRLIHVCESQGLIAEKLDGHARASLYATCKQLQQVSGVVAAAVLVLMQAHSRTCTHSLLSLCCLRRSHYLRWTASSPTACTSCCTASQSLKPCRLCRRLQGVFSRALLLFLCVTLCVRVCVCAPPSLSHSFCVPVFLQRSLFADVQQEPDLPSSSAGTAD